VLAGTAGVKSRATEWKPPPGETSRHLAELSLPETDRARLANQLLDSLVVPDERARDAWRVEIERRAREVIEGKVELLVMAELSALDTE
jgi:hypothetical protein